MAQVEHKLAVLEESKATLSRSRLPLKVRSADLELQGARRNPNLRISDIFARGMRTHTGQNHKYSRSYLTPLTPFILLIEYHTPPPHRFR